jgi:hypothetical protein
MSDKWIVVADGPSKEHPYPDKPEIQAQVGIQCGQACDTEAAAETLKASFMNHYWLYKIKKLEGAAPAPI